LVQVWLVQVWLVQVWLVQCGWCRARVVQCKGGGEC
jgi:hypothetical protein